MKTSEVAKAINIFPRTKIAHYFVLDRIGSAARHDELPYSFLTISNGICWAISSGRLSASIEKRLTELSPYQLTKTVTKWANLPGVTMNDVPRLIIKEFSHASL